MVKVSKQRSMLRRSSSISLQARLLGLPADEREMVRHATLGSEDFALIAQRRGEANQLGFALMLVCLRHPGRVLEGE
jgi:TnpA family transposase